MKAKYHVGQVVMIRASLIPVRLYKKKNEPFIDKNNFVYVQGFDQYGPIGWLDVDEIRPLLKREQGKRTI